MPNQNFVNIASVPLKSFSTQHWSLINYFTRCKDLPVKACDIFITVD
ncbi:MAG: hypothetical protein OEY64_04535 [Nitrospinota bacterium]|nr:hypothetical protein [Nitrospinota bacterium]